MHVNVQVRTLQAYGCGAWKGYGLAEAQSRTITNRHTYHTQYHTYFGVLTVR